VPADAQQPASVTHCEDVAALLASVVGKEEAAGGEIFNCGTNKMCSWRGRADEAFRASTRVGGRPDEAFRQHFLDARREAAMPRRASGDSRLRASRAILSKMRPRENERSGSSRSRERPRHEGTTTSASPRARPWAARRSWWPCRRTPSPPSPSGPTPRASPCACARPWTCSGGRGPFAVWRLGARRGSTPR